MYHTTAPLSSIFEGLRSRALRGGLSVEAKIIFFDKFLINKKNTLKSINEKFDSQISALYFRRNEILKGHSNGTDSELVQIQKEIKKLEEQKKHEIQEVEKQFAYRKFNFFNS